MFQRSSLTALWPGAAGQVQRSAQTRPQQAMLALALVAGVVLILCLYLYQTSRITATRYEIWGLQQEYAAMQRLNSNLLAEYAFELSVISMDRRALAAGFQSYDVPHYVAIAPLDYTRASQDVPTRISRLVLSGAEGLVLSGAEGTEP